MTVVTGSPPGGVYTAMPFLLSPTPVSPVVYEWATGNSYCLPCFSHSTVTFFDQVLDIMADGCVCMFNIPWLHVYTVHSTVCVCVCIAQAPQSLIKVLSPEDVNNTLYKMVAWSLSYHILLDLQKIYKEHTRSTEELTC